MHKGENMGSLRRLGTVLGAASLVLGLVTISVAATTSVATAAGAFKACVVTDTGGINDHSFNASAWLGMQNAAKSNSSITPSYLSSTSSSDYTPNINTFISEKCGIIVTVGFLMADATQAAAKAHPSQKFAIVDYPNNVSPFGTAGASNVDGLTYETNQDAFLGGYLAAAESTTHVVATYGGEDFSTVTIYMDGFVAGVRYYNKMHKAAVKVLGWTPTAGNRATGNFNGKGTFVGSFTNATLAESITTGDFAAGADVVFPVAGGDGLGSVSAAEKAGTGHWIEWVDTNGCTNDASACKWFLASVTKGVTTSVMNAVLSAANGTFTAGDYVGNLRNGGAAFIINSPTVTASLKGTIAMLTTGIEDGTISVNPNSYAATY